MKIFIESGAIFSERSGIGQFVKRLIEAYHEQYPSQHLHLFGFRLFYRRFIPPIPSDKTLRYKLIRWFPGKIYTGLFKHNVSLPLDIMLGASPKDVIIFPNFVRWPLARNKRSISFVHDLSFILFGQFSSPPNRDYMLKYVPQTIKKSDHIVTISESSKKDIINHYNVTPEKVSIVYPFIDTNFFYKRPESEIAAVRTKFKLPKKYILFVSSLEPRKNVSGLMEAYNALDSALKAEYGLVLAGGKGWLNEEIHAQADKFVKQGLNIVRTGYIADEDQPAMYSGASLFAFPTFYEGFGMPPLEAMACGVPVLTSNNSSLPEVVGDAAILVNAEKSSEITSGILTLLSDEKLRKNLIVKGLKQAQRFNPKSSAQQLQAVIDKLV